MTDETQARRRRILAGCANASDTMLLTMLKHRKAALERYEAAGDIPAAIMDTQRDLVEITETVARERGLIDATDPRPGNPEPYDDSIIASGPGNDWRKA